VFFQILRTWVADHEYGNAITQDFIDLSEQISGQDLTNFFDVWLYQPVKPTVW
jgi:aminopeptidase N